MVFDARNHLALALPPAPFILLIIGTLIISDLFLFFLQVYVDDRAVRLLLPIKFEPNPAACRQRAKRDALLYCRRGLCRLHACPHLDCPADCLDRNTLNLLELVALLPRLERLDLQLSESFTAYRGELAALSSSLRGLRSLRVTRDTSRVVGDRSHYHHEAWGSSVGELLNDALGSAAAASLEAVELDGLCKLQPSTLGFLECCTRLTRLSANASFLLLKPKFMNTVRELVLHLDVQAERSTKVPRSARVRVRAVDVVREVRLVLERCERRSLLRLEALTVRVSGAFRADRVRDGCGEAVAVFTALRPGVRLELQLNPDS